MKIQVWSPKFTETGEHREVTERGSTSVRLSPMGLRWKHKNRRYLSWSQILLSAKPNGRFSTLICPDDTVFSSQHFSSRCHSKTRPWHLYWTLWGTISFQSDCTILQPQQDTEGIFSCFRRTVHFGVLSKCRLGCADCAISGNKPHAFLTGKWEWHCQLRREVQSTSESWGQTNEKASNNTGCQSLQEIKI